MILWEPDMKNHPTLEHRVVSETTPWAHGGRFGRVVPLTQKDQFRSGSSLAVSRYGLEVHHFLTLLSESL